MLKTIIRRAEFGFSIGLLLGDGIAMLTGSLGAGELVLVSGKLLDMTGNIALAFLIQSLLSGLYGALTFGTIVFYEIESWPLTVATAAHALVVIGSFVPLSVFLGWASDEPVGFLIMIGCQVVGFLIVWIIMYSIYKKQVKELNELQAQMLRSQKARKKEMEEGF